MKNEGSKVIKIFSGKEGRAYRLVCLFTAIFAGFAINVFFFSCVEVTLSRIFAIFIGGACGAGIQLITRDRKLWFYLFAAVTIAWLTTLFIVSGPEKMSASFCNLYDELILNANFHVQRGYASIRTGLSSGALSDFTLYAIIAVFWSWGISFLAFSDRTVAALIGFAFMSVFFFIGIFPTGWGAIAFSSALLLLCLPESGFNRRRTAFFLVIVTLVSAFSSLFLLYGGSQFMQDAHTALRDGREWVLYGKDTLPEGKLTGADKMIGGDEVKLKVTLNADYLPTLYLRGYVGSDLVGDSWTEARRNDYVAEGNQGLLDYLAEENVPYGQYAKYASLTRTVLAYSVSVKNVKADSEYVYMPYGTFETGEFRTEYDWGSRRRFTDRKEYTYHTFAPDGSCERLAQADWLDPDKSMPRSAEQEKFILYESQYRRFVYEHWLEMDDETFALIKNNAPHTEGGIYYLTKTLRQFFESEYTYTASPERLKKGTDFLSEFYGGKIREGNAAYFASAAVYYYRAYGIPARYAEGYIARAEGGYNEYDVCAKDAHAWVEVYFDGVGWLPVEITPGFYELNADGDNVYDPTIDPDGTQGGVNRPDDSDSTKDPVTPDPSEPSHSDHPNGDADLFYLPVIGTLAATGGSVALLALVALGFVLRRERKIQEKRKALETLCGVEYGRYVYDLFLSECGFKKEKKERPVFSQLPPGCIPGEYERFLSLVEKIVYGERDPDYNERKFVFRFISSLAEGRLRVAGKKRLKLKYVDCVGLS